MSGVKRIARIEPGRRAAKGERVSTQVRRLGVVALMQTTDLDHLLMIARSGAVTPGTATAEGGQPLGKPFGSVFLEAVFEPTRDGDGGGAERLQFFPASRLATFVFSDEVLDKHDFRASAPWSYGRGRTKPETLAREIRADKDTWRAQNELCFRDELSLADVKEILVHPARREQIIAELEAEGIAAPAGKAWRQLIVAPKGKHLSALIPQAVVKDGNRLVPSATERKHLRDAFTAEGIDYRQAVVLDAQRVVESLPERLRRWDAYDVLDAVKKK